MKFRIEHFFKGEENSYKMVIALDETQGVEYAENLNPDYTVARTDSNLRINTELSEREIDYIHDEMEQFVSGICIHCERSKNECKVYVLENSGKFYLEGSCGFLIDNGFGDKEFAIKAAKAYGYQDCHIKIPLNVDSTMYFDRTGQIALCIAKPRKK